MTVVVSFSCLNTGDTSSSTLQTVYGVFSSGAIFSLLFLAHSSSADSFKIIYAFISFHSTRYFLEPLLIIGFFKFRWLCAFYMLIPILF